MSRDDSFGWDLTEEITTNHFPNILPSPCHNPLKQLELRCSILEQEKQQLINRLVQKEQIILSLHKHIQTQATIIKTKNTVWEDSQNFQIQLNGLNKQIGQLLDIIKSNKDQVGNLQKKISEITEENKAFRQKALQSERQLKIVEEELEQYRKENADLAQEIKSLKFEDKGYMTARTDRTASTRQPRQILKSTENTGQNRQKLSDRQKSDIIGRLHSYRKSVNRGQMDHFLKFLK